MDLADPFFTSFKTDQDIDDVMADYDDDFADALGDGTLTDPKPDTSTWTDEKYKTDILDVLADFSDLEDEDVIADLADYFESVDYFWINLWNGLKVKVEVLFPEAEEEAGYVPEYNTESTLPVIFENGKWTKDANPTEFTVEKGQGGESQYKTVFPDKVIDLGSYTKIVITFSNTATKPGNLTGQIGYNSDAVNWIADEEWWPGWSLDAWPVVTMDITKGLGMKLAAIQITAPWEDLEKIELK